MEAVKDHADTLATNTGILLALHDGWMTHNIGLRPGRHGGGAARGAEAACARCGQAISRSPASGRWWLAEKPSWPGSCRHTPEDGTIRQHAPSLVPADLEEEFADAEILRVGADFIGLFIRKDGAAAGLEILHLHYWDRAVLRETPARPEELIGVECRACSLRALRRAEPAWFTGDPDYYSECAECGDLMAEDDYRLWCGQLAAYERARAAAAPALGATPAP
jgi:ribosomal protein S27AE